MRISRRQFLRMSAAAAVSGIVAACSRALESRAPSATAAASSPASPLPAAPSASPSRSPEPDLPTMIGQMLLVGFRGLTPREASATVRDITDHRLGGVLLFDRDQPSGGGPRNVQSIGQVRELVDGLQEAARSAGHDVPLLVAIDQEGGLVVRLRPEHGASAAPSARDLGARDDPAFTRLVARRIGRDLAAAGVNLDLAPVVDLDRNPNNPIIGALGRSFSADPDVVVRQASAFIEGLHTQGIAAAIKHFPGHGSSTGDTHLGVVDVTSTWDPVELEPFAALVRAGLPDAVLTAHVFNANLDADYPATLSAGTITGVLRDRLGWDGVVISDDLQMGAIRAEFGYADAVRLAIEAGVDVLTIANQQVFEPDAVARTVEIIAGLVADGRIGEERLRQSWRRVRRLKQRFA
jgi:beta-N-acetylhexosaminidase